jgi:hypothetical protein
MRNLFFGRRRYAFACLVVGGALLTAAASCEPTKEPVKPPAPEPTGLSIEPTSHDFGNAPASPQTFTVTNNGPDPSGTLSTELGAPNPADFSIGSDTCEGASLAVDTTCDVEVNFAPAGALGDKLSALVVTSDEPADGEAVAELTGTAVP